MAGNSVMLMLTPGFQHNVAVSVSVPVAVSVAVSIIVSVTVSVKTVSVPAVVCCCCCFVCAAVARQSHESGRRVSRKRVGGAAGLLATYGTADTEKYNSILYERINGNGELTETENVIFT